MRWLEIMKLSVGEGVKCNAPDSAVYNPNEWGGTTNLVFNLFSGQFEDSWNSLGGTIRNCAGGLTPWKSWLSCEETFHLWNDRDDQVNHGYIFDVPGFGYSDGQPIRNAGRFSHEAVAVDPFTSIVYETEDAGESAFYKYVPPGGVFGSRKAGRLLDGGELYAMVINQTSRFDLRGGFEDGQTFNVTWQKVEDPEAINDRTFDNANDAAIISRGEGCWYDMGKIYFVSTSGGEKSLGQIWCYDPRLEKLTLIYESRQAEDVDGPDNIAISRRGGIILCEDGDSNPKRLIGLTNLGQTFEFAKNLVTLNTTMVESLEGFFPGVAENFYDNLPEDGALQSFTSREWAGATFYGNWLFVNIQSPGITFAIKGPWQKGPL